MRKLFIIMAIVFLLGGIALALTANDDFRIGYLYEQEFKSLMDIKHDISFHDLSMRFAIKSIPNSKTRAVAEKRWANRNYYLRRGVWMVAGAVGCGIASLVSICMCFKRRENR